MAQKQTQNDIELIPLAEAAKLTGYTPEYLNLLSRKGKLKAEKIGRNWYTKTEWVNSFLAPIPGESNEASLMTLSEAATITGYTPEYLNSLVRRGKLNAKKIGRNWHTKKIWLDDFLAGVGNARIQEENIKSGETSDGQTVLPEQTEETAISKKENYSKPDEPIKDIKLEAPAYSRAMQIFAGLSSVFIIIPLIFVSVAVTKKIIREVRSENEFAQSVFENENLDSVIVNENS
ncbi:MAG: helix-turn-helix domain-containing protein, partial [Candidatus Gracilibacteria bacterium]